MNSRSITLATLALCAAPLLLAQSDQSKPSANQPADLSQTTPPANSPANQNPNQGSSAAQQTTAQSDSAKQQTEPAAAPAQKNQPPAAVAAQTNANATAQANQPQINIQLAAADAKNRTAKRYSGWRVKSSERDELGKVKDFLIDTQTGKADFALISSGGVAGIGDKLRLVPATALKRMGESNDFMLEISKERWEAMSTVDDNELKSHRLTIPDSQRREIESHFVHSTGATQDSGFYSASLTSHYVFASDLNGRDVRSGNDRLGKIEDVVLDLDASTAQALIEPEKNFTGMKNKLLVPFNALTIGEGKRPQVTTLLTRADFQQLRSGNPPTNASSAVAAATPPTREPASPSSENSKVTAGAANTEQSQNVAAATSPDTRQLSPTGRSDAAQKDTQKNTDVAANEPAAPAKAGEKTTTNKPEQSSQVASNDESKTTAGTKQSQGIAATAQSDKQSSPTGRSEVESKDAQKSTSIAANEPSPSAKSDSDPTKAVANPPQNTTDNSGRVASTDKSSANKDENLTPTGQNSSDTIPAGTDPALLATARAIRKALDDDPALSSTDVRVTPENGKVVLRGRVSDQKIKTAIVETATREIKGWKIDDQISVENR